jgi:hypothetical protein
MNAVGDVGKSRSCQTLRIRKVTLIKSSPDEMSVLDDYERCCLYPGSSIVKPRKNKE